MRTFLAAIAALVIATPAFADPAPKQIANSQTTGATNAPVTVTLAATPGARWVLRQVNASCSAGTSGVTVTDGGTTIFATPAAEVATTRDSIPFPSPTGMSAQVNSAMVVTLATCGVGNTGTLQVIADLL